MKMIANEMPKFNKSFQTYTKQAANMPIRLLNLSNFRNFNVAQNTMQEQITTNSSFQTAIVLKFTNSPSSLSCTALIANLVNMVLKANIATATIEKQTINKSFQFQKLLKYSKRWFLSFNISSIRKYTMNMAKMIWNTSTTMPKLPR
jgi:hypothetical protein